MTKFNDYENCLLKDEVILKSQQRFKSKGHHVFAENINKIALSNNDDKRIVSSDKITSIHMDIEAKTRWFNNIISEKYPRDRWEYLDQIVLKGSMGVIR